MADDRAESTCSDPQEVVDGISDVVWGRMVSRLRFEALTVGFDLPCHIAEDMICDVVAELVQAGEGR